MPTGHALPELDPTQPATLVPFLAGANRVEVSRAGAIKVALYAGVIVHSVTECKQTLVWLGCWPLNIAAEL